MIRRIHLTEADNYHPSLVSRAGRRRSEDGPAFHALADRQYDGWVSLEVIHAEYTPEMILAETREFLVTVGPARGE